MVLYCRHLCECVACEVFFMWIWRTKADAYFLRVNFFSGMLYMRIMWTADDEHIVLLYHNSYYFKFLLVLYRNHSVRFITQLSQRSILNTYSLNVLLHEEIHALTIVGRWQLHTNPFSCEIKFLVGEMRYIMVLHGKYDFVNSRWGFGKKANSCAFSPNLESLKSYLPLVTMM